MRAAVRDQGHDILSQAEHGWEKWKLTTVPIAEHRSLGRSQNYIPGIGYGTPTTLVVAVTMARHCPAVFAWAFEVAGAQRTKVIDEAADFDVGTVSSAGLNMWTTEKRIRESGRIQLTLHPVVLLLVKAKGSTLLLDLRVQSRVLVAVGKGYYWTGEFLRCGCAGGAATAICYSKDDR